MHSKFDSKFVDVQSEHLTDSEHNDVVQPPNKRARIIPRLLDGTFYEILKHEGDQVEAMCTNCQSVRKGNIKSTGNFFSHYRSKHESIMSKVRAYIDQKETQNLDSADTSLKKCIAIIGPAIKKEHVRNSQELIEN